MRRSLHDSVHPAAAASGRLGYGPGMRGSNHLSSLCLSAVLVIIGACGPGGRGDDDGDSDGTDGDGTTMCAPGIPSRCVGSDYQTCEGGVYVTQDTCTAGEICSLTLGGCAACDPGLQTTCVGSDVHTCNADGTIGAVVESCGIEACTNGSCGSGSACAAGDYIYLVDDLNNLIKFDPREGVYTFSVIGQLSCPAGLTWPEVSDPLPPMQSTPFSMSVDREAKAWVLYSSGEIFHVHTETAACPATTSAKAPSGWKLFGMGFVTETAGGMTEKLHISGGPADVQTIGNLGAIDPGTLAVATAGPLPTAEYSPELTGTGNGELYAYFPGQTNTFVARLDKTNSSIQQQWALPGLDGSPAGWAFAHWGGRLHIFISTVDPLFGMPVSQRVLRLDPMTGMTTTIVQNMPYKIVGAGVSTCAPVVVE